MLFRGLNRLRWAGRNEHGHGSATDRQQETAMEQWALVLADRVLLVVALAGGIMTCARVRRRRRTAAMLAASACGLLVLTMIFDMVLHTRVDRSTTLDNIGVLATMTMIAISVGLLIGSAGAGRPGAATRPARRRARHGHTGTADGAGSRAPAPAGGSGGSPAAGPAYVVPNGVVPQAQPAAGWTPPQQQPGQPDWNIHSGVWSIPRGTFDRPPPDHR